MVSPANTYPGLTHARRRARSRASRTSTTRPATRNYVRVVASDDNQGRIGAQYMKDELGVTKVFILDDKELYGKGVADAFEAPPRTSASPSSATRAGTRTPRTTRALMTKIKASGADGIYIGGVSTNNGGQLRQGQGRDRRRQRRRSSCSSPTASCSRRSSTRPGADNVERRVRHGADAAAGAS